MSALGAARQWSPTYDEPLHLTAGYVYWTHGDFRLHPENGNLSQRWSALPLLAGRPELPIEGLEAAWQRSDLPRLMDAFVSDPHRRGGALLPAARRAALVWSLALGLLVFGWSRHLWGDAAACFSVSLYAISPTMLAHAPLVTSDMASAFLLLAATAAYWRHLNRLSVGNLALSAVVTAGAVLAKFSFVVLPVVFGLLALWRLLGDDTWGWSWRGVERPLRGRIVRASALGASALVHAVVAVGAVWLAYEGRFLPSGEGLPEALTYYRPWSQVLPESGLYRKALDVARSWRLLPEAFLYGLSMVVTFAQERPAFLNGEFRSTGWWWFFPYAHLVKSPVAELLAVAAAMGLWLRRSHGTPVALWWRSCLRRAVPVLPLLALLGVYGAVSLTSNLNIGHRHLLPIQAPLFILVGGIVASGAARWRRKLAVALLAVALVEHVTVRPHYLAFFNVAVGGPQNGWRHLVDSSLDWGQELPRVSAWLAERTAVGEQVHYSLFGALRPAAWGIRGQPLAPEFALDPWPLEALRAGVYVVSATMLQNVYGVAVGGWTAVDERNFQELRRAFDDNVAAGRADSVVRPWDPWEANARSLDRLRFARLTSLLRLREPVAVIAHSVFVYRLSEGEAATVDRGSPAQYLALIEAATER